MESLIALMQTFIHANALGLFALLLILSIVAGYFSSVQDPLGKYDEDSAHDDTNEVETDYGDYGEDDESAQESQEASYMPRP